MHRYNLGEPCGIIRDLSELFNSEGIVQVQLDENWNYLISNAKVWSIICELIGDMSEERRKELKGWGYDDMCHLKVS